MRTPILVQTLWEPYFYSRPQLLRALRIAMYFGGPLALLARPEDA